MIIYIYKLIINLIPNPGLLIEYNPRTKTRVIPIQSRTGPCWVKKARSASFFYQAPRLFNFLPANLRELEDIGEPNSRHIDSFKQKLDDYLKAIPDLSGNSNNSLLQ